jgi:hypothetical protein
MLLKPHSDFLLASDVTYSKTVARGSNVALVEEPPAAGMACPEIMCCGGGSKERTQGRKTQKYMHVAGLLLRSSQKIGASGGSRQTRADANISAHRRIREQKFAIPRFRKTNASHRLASA